MKRISFLLLVLAMSVSHALAQATPPPPPPMVEEDDEILEIESRLVVVPVSVLDSEGRPVFGLKASDFIIREEKRTQQIAEVSDAEKIPLEIALLFDVSGSTDPMFKFEQETAAKFLNEVMRPIDRATIFTIGEVPYLIQSRNVAIRSIQTIRGIQPTKQHTAFFDTVTAAAKYLRENAPPKSRKVIVTISDGEDTTSIGIRKGNLQIYAEIGRNKNRLTTEGLKKYLTRRRNEVRIREQDRSLQALQDADTVFYSINPAGNSYKLNRISVRGQDNMARFASETGGTAFLPKLLPVGPEGEYRTKATLNENARTLAVIFNQLKNELRAQYLVQYYSDGEYPANRYVNLNVRLTRKRNLRLRARRGYFVKDQ